MAYRQQRGTLMIQRTYRGVGRLQKASGTRDPKVHARMVAVLDTLYQQGRSDILADVQRGAISVMEVFAKWSCGELESVGNVITTMPLAPAVKSWLSALELTPKTIQSYREQMSYVLRHGSAKASIRELPSLLSKYRAERKKAGKNRSFNMARAACLSFVKNAVKAPQLYVEIAQIPPLSKKRRRPGTPLSPQALKELCSRLSAKSQAAFLALCVSGMRVSEYFRDNGADWEIAGSHLVIEGTKTKGSRRKVPLLAPIASPAVHRKTLEIALRKASGGKITMRDGRRTFSHWLAESGVPRVRRLIYLGHEQKDIHDLYEWHEVQEYLKADTDRLRNWLQGQVLEAANLSLMPFQLYYPDTGITETVGVAIAKMEMPVREYQLPAHPIELLG